MTDTKYVYQLVAKGTLRNFDSPLTVASSTVFSTKEFATGRIEKFRELLTTADLMQMDPNELEITVKRLEIVE